jgi:hypothetical protein
LPVDDLDTRLNGFGWEDRWDNFAGPQAKAFHLLKGLDLGHSGSALKQAGQIIFQEFGGSPGNSYTWVELHDDLTVSLLQARLIELNLPIDVEIGTREWEVRYGAPLFATCRHRPCASLAMVLGSDCVAPRNVRPMAPSPRHCPTTRHGDPCSVERT